MEFRQVAQISVQAYIRIIIEIILSIVSVNLHISLSSVVGIEEGFAERLYIYIYIYIKEDEDDESL